MKKSKKNIRNADTHLLDDFTPFAVREAFNHLRTNLMYTLNEEEGCPIFAITSAEEAAGKSTMMANIAISYAMAAKKILLVDADMRVPMQSRIFKMDKTLHGLSELLSGIEENDTNLIRPSGIEGLDVLLAGITPPNPSELIMSSRLEQYLKKWRMEYDAIFIDFPPVGIVTDTLAPHKLLTGYIFVIRSENSDSRKVTLALDMMKKVDAKLLGVVLNDIDAKGYHGKYKKNSRYANAAGQKVKSTTTYTSSHERSYYNTNYTNNSKQ